MIKHRFCCVFVALLSAMCLAGCKRFCAAAMTLRLVILVMVDNLLLLPCFCSACVKQPRGSSSTGCTRLSAPRLLSLNVPFLIPLRQVWDKLPNLRQVLLMVGSSSSSSSRSNGAAGCLWHDMSLQGAHAGCGSGSLGMTSLSNNVLVQQQQQQQRQQLVRGVFSLQQLEQQWQQEAHWAAAHQDSQQQLDRQAEQQATSFADVSCMTGVAGQCRGQPLNQTSAAETVLPGYAVEAVQGMILSCMDRCSSASYC
jgi:hypothetical protein